MNPEALRNLIGHGDIGVTMNTYTHLGLEDAQDELKRVEGLRRAREEMEKLKGEKPVTKSMFKAV